MKPHINDVFNRTAPQRSAQPRIELQETAAGWFVVLINDRGERRYGDEWDLLTEQEAQAFGNELAEFLHWPVVWVMR